MKENNIWEAYYSIQKKYKKSLEMIDEKWKNEL